MTRVTRWITKRNKGRSSDGLASTTRDYVRLLKVSHGCLSFPPSHPLTNLSLPHVTQMSELLPNSPSSSGAPVERSIFGTDPLDEFVCHVGGWIYSISRGGQVLEELPPGCTDAEIEVEAKIGTLIDTNTRNRISLPVLNETILRNDMKGVRFESGMTSLQHKHFNDLLNSLCMPAASSSGARPKVSYKRYQEVDYFFNSDDGPRGEKIRVTKDSDTLRTKERGSVIKKRLGNLEVFCPNRPFDYRISVNLEIQSECEQILTQATSYRLKANSSSLVCRTASEPDPSVEHAYFREKNRLSYTHTGLRVDLTQVKTNNSNDSYSSSEPTLQHELEVELLQAPLRLITPQSSSLRAASATAAAAAAGGNVLNGTQGGQDWTKYEDEIMRFLNDVRLLIRNAVGPA